VNVPRRIAHGVARVTALVVMARGMPSRFMETTAGGSLIADAIRLRDEARRIRATLADAARALVAERNARRAVREPGARRTAAPPSADELDRLAQGAAG